MGTCSCALGSRSMDLVTSSTRGLSRAFLEVLLLLHRLPGCGVIDSLFCRAALTRTLQIL